MNWFDEKNLYIMSVSGFMITYNYLGYPLAKNNLLYKNGKRKTIPFWFLIDIITILKDVIEKSQTVVSKFCTKKDLEFWPNFESSPVY